MNNNESGIDKLIDEVKNEAILKAKNEASAIVEDAQKTAAKIIKEAEIKSDEILQNAKEKRAKEQEMMASELRLAARDYSVKIADRLKNQMFFPIIKEKIRVTLNEPEFLKNVLHGLITDFAKENSGPIEVIVRKDLIQTLSAFFASSIFDSLDKKPDIRLKDEEGLDGFILKKKSDHYVFDFSAETISKELMHLVDPSLRKYFISQKRPSMNNAMQEAAAV